MDELNRIVVLGSGKSALNLTEKELDYIRKCTIRIGLNKYFAFYKKLDIRPTHVYMVDVHGNCLDWVKYFVKLCKKNKLSGISFIFDNSLSSKFYSNKFSFFRKSINEIIKKNENKPFLISLIKKLKKILKVFIKGEKYLGQYFIYPRKCSIEFIKRSSFLEAKTWAKSFTEELFHFRTSFTSLLNYISIKYPQKPVLLVGTDFNTGEYFFQKELEELNIEWKDFTSNESKKNDSHFSIQDYQNTNLLDKMPYILEQLNKSENKLTCINQESILVENGFVEYINLNQFLI